MCNAPYWLSKSSSLPMIVISNAPISFYIILKRRSRAHTHRRWLSYNENHSSFFSKLFPFSFMTTSQLLELVLLHIPKIKFVERKKNYVGKRVCQCCCNNSAHQARVYINLPFLCTNSVPHA